jgi:hypothetical protein
MCKGKYAESLSQFDQKNYGRKMLNLGFFLVYFFILLDNVGGKPANGTAIPNPPTATADEPLPPDPVQSPVNDPQESQDDNNVTLAPPPPDGTTSPPVTDPAQCLISVEIAECEPLLQSIGSDLDPNCPCHSFCGSSYLGCCDYAADCPLDCEPLLGEKFVAGCVIPDSLPPSENIPPPNPTIQPTETSIEAPASAPSPAPSEIEGQECLITSNENECSALLQQAGPREDGCVCRNFCSGQEIDCCPLGQECPSLECTGDFVAGCRNMQPQTVSPEPSPAPTPAPKCYVSVNTQRCNQFTLAQQPQPECDCYNYCNGEYIGCSEYNVFESIQCEGEVVAGCELVPGPRCLVSVNTGECGPLMEGVEEEELLGSDTSGCSCFNFCGNEYHGCCGYNEFCGFKCAGPFSVTGCTMEDAPAGSGRNAKAVTQETVITVGDFYAPQLWPSSFFSNGAADKDDRSQGGDNAEGSGMNGIEV